MQTQDQIDESIQPAANTGTPEAETAAADAADKAGEAQEQQEQQQESAEDAAGKARPKGVQSRIDELTRAKYEAEREAAYWRGLAAAGKGQEQSPEQQPAKPAAKPTPDQFTDYAEYIEALTDWKTDQKVSQALAEREEREQQARQRAEADARAKTWAERQQAARAALPDYDEVLSAAADVRIAPHVQETILDSEHGPRIAYHLAQHPDEAARISALQPLAAARELGRLEATLAAAPKPSAPKTVSNAPPPISPVRGTGGRFEKPPESMTDSEWWASRKKA